MQDFIVLFRTEGRLPSSPAGSLAPSKRPGPSGQCHDLTASVTVRK